MKASLSLLVLVAVTLSAAAGSPPPATAPASYVATRIDIKAWDPLLTTFVPRAIAVGTPAAVVRNALGRPRQMLSPEAWVFDDCMPGDARVTADHCTFLLVTFSAGRVQEMKFVNRPFADMVAPNLQESSTSRIVSNR